MGNHKLKCERCGADLGWSDHDVAIFVHVYPDHLTGFGCNGNVIFDLCYNCSMEIMRFIYNGVNDTKG